MSASVNLTERQQRFIQAYVQTGEGAEAARRAGYSERSARQQASSLLKRPEIRAALEQAMARRAEEAEVTQEWVTERLQALADDAEHDSAKVAALKLLGKQVGMFVDRTHITSEEGAVDADLAAASDAELETELRELRADAGDE